MTSTTSPERAFKALERSQGKRRVSPRAEETPGESNDGNSPEVVLDSDSDRAGLELPGPGPSERVAAAGHRIIESSGKRNVCEWSIHCQGVRIGREHCRRNSFCLPGAIGRRNYYRESRERADRILPAAWTHGARDAASIFE